MRGTAFTGLAKSRITQYTLTPGCARCITSALLICTKHVPRPAANAMIRRRPHTILACFLAGNTLGCLRISLVSLYIISSAILLANFIAIFCVRRGVYAYGEKFPGCP
jgi:hypothetical protein